MNFDMQLSEGWAVLLEGRIRGIFNQEAIVGYTA